MQVAKTVFISYRRTNVFNALAIYQHLTAHGFDVFFDYDSIKSGSFEQIILNQIAARAHFVVLLTPSALERCNEPGDLLRREIEHAIATKRNIVPLMFEGFSFNDVKPFLTGKLTMLSAYNGMTVPVAYFEAAMEKLRKDFLNISLDVILHPTPAGERTAVKQIQAAAAQQPVPSERQLTAEGYFERGLKRDASDYEGKIRDYNEAIRLNPEFAAVYAVLGSVLVDMKKYDEAISAFSNAIQFSDNDSPLMSNIYFSRGAVFFLKEELDKAINDFNQTLFHDSQHANTYLIRGAAYTKLNKFDDANIDYQQYIDLGGENADRIRAWMLTNEAKRRQQSKR